MYRILIVEDDFTIARLLARHLGKWGYEAQFVTDLSSIMEQFIAFDPQLVLLDISLPYFNGYYWCTQIRKVSQLPIVFISSAADNMNIVMAINMGGDDFIAKPFDLEVLTAKIQALIRRSYCFKGQASLMEHHGLILNLGDATVAYQDARVELTKNELRILQMLLENAGSTVSREAIMMKLWESDSFVDDNTLSVNVARLRRKLAEVGLDGGYIKTKKGEGYRIDG